MALCVISSVRHVQHRRLDPPVECLIFGHDDGETGFFVASGRMSVCLVVKSQQLGIRSRGDEDRRYMLCVPVRAILRNKDARTISEVSLDEAIDNNG